jgi:cell pole-organizing protein PopZ
MSQPAKAPEPTMEEILASIRRIIADDDAAKPAPPAAKPAAGPSNNQDDIDAMLAGFDAAPAEEPPPPPPPAPVADVLELTEAMQAAPPFRTVDSAPDVVFDEAPEPPRRSAPEPAPPPMDHGPLLSNRTTAAVDMAFNSLAHTVLVQNSRTLEDLVREMLKPLLKSWLDDNLPNMVERMVRAEIERVSRGRG